jgi:hypothetical protein
MTDITVGDEIMYATAAQGEKGAGHGRTRVSDEFYIEEDAEGLEEALALVPLYTHDSCMMNDSNLKEIGYRKRNGGENDSEGEMDRQIESMASFGIGETAKNESSVGGVSNKGGKKLIGGRLSTSIVPNHIASTSNIAELPVAVFRQIVRYILFEECKAVAFASTGVDRNLHGDRSEQGGLSTLQALKNQKKNIVRFTSCVLDGDKEVSAEELENINNFIMARTKLIAFDFRSPTLCLDRLCCEGIVSVPSSSATGVGRVFKDTNSPIMVSIYILYGVLPVPIMAEMNALKNPSKYFKDRRRSHNNWRPSIPLLSSISSPAIKESNSILKTVQSDRRAVRLCPLNILPNLQSGLTVHVYDHHSNVSNTLTLQGMMLGRLALFLGHEETLDDLSLMAKGILLHASTLLSISHVEMGGKNMCTSIGLDLNATKNSAKAGDEVMISPSQATRVIVSDLPQDLSFVALHNNHQTKVEDPNERVSVTTPYLVNLNTASSVNHSPSSIRNGKSNYTISQRSQKLNKARAFLRSASK